MASRPPTSSPDINNAVGESDDRIAPENDRVAEKTVPVRDVSPNSSTIGSSANDIKLAVPAASIELRSTTDSAEYLSELASESLDTQYLPTVAYTGPGLLRGPDRAPLFPLSESRTHVRSEDLRGEYGTILGVNVAVRLQTIHLRAKITDEVIAIASSNTVTDEQLTQIQKLLFELGNIYRIRTDVQHDEIIMMKQLHNSRRLFSDGDTPFPDFMPAPEPLMFRARSEGSDSANSRPQKRKTLGQAIRDYVMSSLPGDRQQELPRTRSDPSSVEDGGVPTSPSRGQDERKHNRVPEWLILTGKVCFLVVAFIPAIVAVSIHEIYEKLKPNIREDDRYRSTAKSYDRRRRRQEFERKRNWPTRFVAALLGGCSLIAPMLIMSLDPSLTKSLITTSLFILLFAIMIAWRSSMQPWEVLTATATYAAVLVVFTGVSS